MNMANVKPIGFVTLQERTLFDDEADITPWANNYAHRLAALFRHFSQEVLHERLWAAEFWEVWLAISVENFVMTLHCEHNIIQT